MLERAVIIPTLNAEAELKQVLPRLVAAIPACQVWVIDSASQDGTLDLCRYYGINVHSIARAHFNHGGTRNLGRSLIEADFLVYMTQDAVPATEDFLDQLLLPFQDPLVAVAFGRQLPRPNSSPLEAFPRLFNYPEHSVVKSKADLSHLGIKTFFCSDSFCAYRTTAWDEVGGFQQHTLTWEDQHIAARLIREGYKIAYAARAHVYHSHNYTLKQEFQRNFDAGAFLNKERWILEMAGRVEGEGLRFLKQQLKYLWCMNQTHLIPYTLLATIVKYAGYRVGQLEPLLPCSWKRYLSQQGYFW